MSIFRESGNPVEIAYSLFHMGHLRGLVYGNYEEARQLYQEGLDILIEADHLEGIAHGMANVGTA